MMNHPHIPSLAVHRGAPRHGLLSSAIASCLLIASPQVFGQSASATLRGQVTANAAPATNAKITATNTLTGLTRSVTAAPNGTYTLAGLPPGTYKVDVSAGGQSTTETVVLRVGQTSTLDLGVGKAPERELESVTVSATQLYETKTSEVGNYVSTKQIELLPQNSRNFLAFADTVPGVQFTTNGDGSSELRGGAQAAKPCRAAIRSRNWASLSTRC